MTESTTVQSSDFKNYLSQLLSHPSLQIDSAIETLSRSAPNITSGLIEMMDSLTIEDSLKTLPRLITQYICRNINSIYSEGIYDSHYITNLLLKLPDLINNHYQTSALSTDYYFTNIVKSIHLLESLHHQLELLSKLINNRKEDYLAKEVYMNADSCIPSLIPHLKHTSPLLFQLFKNASTSSFTQRFPTIWDDLSTFLTTQLPFKEISIQDTTKLYEILSYYKLELACLEYVSKSWSSDRLLTESETRRNLSKIYIDITILLYHLLHRDLNPKFNNEIFIGIQSRLSSPFPQVRNSGVVIYTQLVASRIAEFVRSDSPAISYSLEQFLSSLEEAQHFTSDSDDEQDSEGEETYTGYYLDDLIEALQSDSIERSSQAYTQAWKVIESDLPDLELQTEKIAEVLFKSPNKFAQQDFEELRNRALVSLAFMQPRTMARIIGERLSSSEVPFSSKHLGLSVLVSAAKRLSEPFFTQQAISQAPEVQLTDSQAIIQERLLAKTRRFHTFKPKYRVSKSNPLQIHFQYFCSSIVSSLHHLRDSALLAKAIYSIYELFDYIGNLRVSETVSQAIYSLRHAVRSYISSPYREVKESCMILFTRLADFLLGDSEDPQALWTSYEESYPSILEDVEEIRRNVAISDSSLQNLAERCSVSMLALRSMARIR
jgi:hypothetical protein